MCVERDCGERLGIVTTSRITPMGLVRAPNASPMTRKGFAASHGDAEIMPTLDSGASQCSAASPSEAGSGADVQSADARRARELSTSALVHSRFTPRGRDALELVRSSPGAPCLGRPRSTRHTAHGRCRSSGSSCPPFSSRALASSVGVSDRLGWDTGYLVRLSFGRCG